MAVRILVVDDHPAVIDSLVRVLGIESDLDVVGTARSLEEAHAVLGRLAGGVDVVACDIQMGGDAEGLRLLEEAGRAGTPRFLMLSAFEYPTLIRAAYERGAGGYLIKTSELSEIVSAVRAVARGGSAFSSAALRSLRSATRRPSAREIQVLELVIAGAGNDAIAQELALSLKTVESHLRRLFNRYGVMNRTELAVLAMREGWVKDPVVERSPLA